MRIIPTRVGTSQEIQLQHLSFWDHPHACGDKYMQYYERNVNRGSSPRVWGQAIKRAALSTVEGIIPTRVGTSRNVFKICGICRDHPHACGDKELAESIKVNGLGSSPRVWGQDSQDIICTPFFRIIPTRVGTSG